MLNNSYYREDKTPTEASAKEKIFVCPKHGLLSSDDVRFLCNRCRPEDLIQKNGLYICPSCLDGKENNFQCALCGSEEVRLLEGKLK